MLDGSVIRKETLMNLRWEMEEGVRGVEGGEKKIGHKRSGKQNLGVGREGSVLCYAVYKLPKNCK